VLGCHSQSPTGNSIRIGSLFRPGDLAVRGASKPSGPALRGSECIGSGRGRRF
jgi:hypothetical protein